MLQINFAQHPIQLLTTTMEKKQSLESSSRTIYCCTYSKKSDPNSQLILGKNHRRYLDQYFSPSKTQGRKVKYMERIIFEIFAILRNNSSKTSGQDIPPTSLMFEWLYPLQWKGHKVSTLLRVENALSKERVYLLDLEEWQSFIYDWSTSIIKDSEGFSSKIMIYDPAEKEDIVVKRPYYSQTIPSSDFSEEPSVQNIPFQIPTYQRADFSSCYTDQKLDEELGKKRRTKEQKAEQAIDRIQELTSFLKDKRPMPKSLSKHSISIFMVTNDIIKFLGFSEPILFQTDFNGKLCIRNTQRICFQFLKIGDILSLHYEKGNIALYQTKARYDDMLVFFNFCYNNLIEVFYGDQVDHQARLKMLEIVDISLENVAETRQKLKHIDLTQFENCVIHRHHTKRFEIQSQTIKKFISKCSDKSSQESQCLKYHRFYSEKNTPYYKDQKSGRVFEQVNYRQYMIVDEMEKKPTTETKKKVNLNKMENVSKGTSGSKS